MVNHEMSSWADAVVTASDPGWVGLFAGFSVRKFPELVGVLRRRGGEADGRVGRGCCAQ
jgi:hypothetical protein